MKEHNCETCEFKGNCAIEGIHTWIEKHFQEFKELDDVSYEPLDIIFQRINQLSILPLNTALLSSYIAHTFALGYYYGREYVPIPPAFRKEFNE